jgi:hypothetical protein
MITHRPPRAVAVAPEVAMNILLAESEPRLADVYADFLRGLGHDVRFVSGASAALDQICGIGSWAAGVRVWHLMSRGWGPGTGPP